MESIPRWGWITFGVVVVILFVVDLLAHRGERGKSRKSALVWSIIWVGAGLSFDGFVWVVFGWQAAQEYLAAYLIEKSLSLDNLFVFLIIFKSLNIPQERQHTTLYWGIVGAVVFRAIFIFAGVEAIERWGWISYVFGAILLYAAYHSYQEDPTEDQESRMVHWLSNHLPVTHQIHDNRFITRVNGHLVATPLMIALIGIELTDVMFAIDSVPAALAMTRNLFILYSSNIFAILGLRALYLLLAHTIAELKYLHYGLAIVLAFAGFKIMTEPWIHIPALLSVAFIVVVIAGATWISVRARESH